MAASRRRRLPSLVERARVLPSGESVMWETQPEKAAWASGFVALPVRSQRRTCPLLPSRDRPHRRAVWGCGPGTISCALCSSGIGAVRMRSLSGVSVGRGPRLITCTSLVIVLATFPGFCITVRRVRPSADRACGIRRAGGLLSSSTVLLSRSQSFQPVLVVVRLYIPLVEMCPPMLLDASRCGCFSLPVAASQKWKSTKAPPGALRRLPVITVSPFGLKARDVATIPGCDQATTSLPLATSQILRSHPCPLVPLPAAARRRLSGANARAATCCAGEVSVWTSDRVAASQMWIGDP